jgi:glutamate racemase
MISKGAIGVFDSGYGGLTVLKEIKALLPDYDYLYLGDNKRAPYGPLDFDTVYAYTLEAVKWFFAQECSLVILACNTASAKALRTIQQNDLPKIAPNKRVLGVIRPTAELMNTFTKTNHVGILATKGTVTSQSYVLECEKFHPEIKISQQACTEWVELVEQGKHLSNEADAPIQKHLNALLEKDKNIDCMVLACTHYPLLAQKIKAHLPNTITVIEQGKIVAESLVSYLSRHKEIEEKCSKNAITQFYTTGIEADFNAHASLFYGEEVLAKQINL